MNEKNIEIKSGIGYIISNVLSRGILFLITPIVTRVLTVNEYGEYSFLYHTIKFFIYFDWIKFEQQYRS